MSTIISMNSIGTLRELKQKYTGKIKLGTAAGSAFIYCGKIEDLDIERLGLEFSSQDRESLARTDKKIESARPTTWSEYKRLLAIKNKRNKTNVKPTRKDYDKWKLKTESELEKHKRTRERLLKENDKFYNFDTRKVVRMYPSADEKDTLIVIIEGREDGNAWTTEEYENGGK